MHHLSKDDGTDARRYWLFQASPRWFDLAGAIRGLAEIRFVVTRYADDIRTGDGVFLWVSGPDGGLVGKAVVTAEPADLPAGDDERPYYVQPYRFEGFRRRVFLGIEVALAEPVPRFALRNQPRLAGLAFLRSPRGTNFPVSPEAARALEAILHDCARDESQKQRKDR